MAQINKNGDASALAHAGQGFMTRISNLISLEVSNIILWLVMVDHGGIGKFHVGPTQDDFITPEELAGALDARAADAARLAALALALTATCLLFSATTFNQPENSLPYLFLTLGLAHGAVARAVRSDRGPGLGRAIGAAFLLVAAKDALTFHTEVNAKTWSSTWSTARRRPSPRRHRAWPSCATRFRTG